MTLQISPEQMAIYKRTARERQAQYEREMRARREAAWVVARQAAQVLKGRFGATRVIAFGSLAHGAWFHARSDIDLAAEGIPEKDHFSAWGSLEDLTHDFEFDLILFESAPEHLRRSIHQGVEI
ncbi:MAG: nucleotidyltransferase domain-containing protein [Chloroflexi bacterium]|nr:nucleotidyltransferase domain-containing protein [Chloroflexota bacterium]